MWWFLKKLEISILWDPIMPLLGICPKDAHSYHKNICSAVFIAVLLIIDRTWKQSKCPSTEGWIKKMWYIYTIGYYSVVKKTMTF